VPAAHGADPNEARGTGTTVAVLHATSRGTAMAEAARFSHHMSDEDALMWNIEKDPVLRSTILAVAFFDSVPDWERLRRRIESTSLLIPRFRQRVVSPPFRMGPPRWTVEQSFDLDFHLRRTRLPAPGTQ